MIYILITQYSPKYFLAKSYKINFYYRFPSYINSKILNSSNNLIVKRQYMLNRSHTNQINI